MSISSNYQLYIKYLNGIEGLPVLKYMGDEYYGDQLTRMTIKDIQEEYPTFIVTDDSEVSLLNLESLSLLKFTKWTKIQTIAHFIASTFNGHKYPNLMFDSLKLMNINDDELLNELLMTNSDHCLVAAKIILKAKCDLNMLIDIKETIHNKAIFDYMIDFEKSNENYPEQLVAIRTTLINLWSKLTLDEKKSFTGKIRSKITKQVALFTNANACFDNIVDNLRFMRQFI